MSDSDSGISFVAGLVFGALIGGVLGVLFAPQSGAETRQQLKEETIELSDKARVASVKARERAEEVSARGRIVLEERVAQLEEAVAEGKKAASKTREDLRAKVQQARSGEAQLPPA
jgi:gas vesicle protein